MALHLMAAARKNYFRCCVFAGGAGLEQMTEEEGKADILKLDMAKNGHCDSKP
jgi:hypothetical protein